MSQSKFIGTRPTPPSGQQIWTVCGLDGSTATIYADSIAHVPVTGSVLFFCDGEVIADYVGYKWLRRDA